jgi:hypothetical protein
MKNKASIIPFAIMGLVVVLGCGRFAQQLNKTTETKPASDSNEFTLAGKEWKTFELEQMEMVVDRQPSPSVPARKSSTPCRPTNRQDASRLDVTGGL